MADATMPRISGILRKAVLDCIARNGHTPAASASDELAPEALFSSARAEALKQEILRAGKKLWQRAYVDGNGGNISTRIGDDHVICTPTLCSKGDLQVEDLSLVDLNNCQICGDRAQTSELLLHLEIYKAVPSARAVIHCHPPYTTAHAMAGIVPRGNLIPEQEVFVGPVALAPYETPGTLAFARTVLPFVHDHNTILLTNHGVVCWGDTVTHAEWYVEVVENYCKTLVIASQLGAPIKEIPADKISGLLEVKKKLGLPDPRLRDEAPAEKSGQRGQNSHHRPALQAQEIDELVASITTQVLAFLENAK